MNCSPAKSGVFLMGCKEGMHLFGQNLALIVNTILLSAVYLIGVGPTSLIARLVGKRFLETKLRKGKNDSYWQDLSLKKRPMEEYYRQF